MIIPTTCSIKMAMESYTKFLPFGKQYHIFFYHGSSSKDREWTTDTIQELESYRYIGGCNSFHFESSKSVFKNIAKILDESIVLAFVLSRISISCDSFIYYLESTVMRMLKKKMGKSILPVLVEDCDIPQCLDHYEPLFAYDERNHWWPKLLRVLSFENPSSSSGESDEELKEMHDKFMKLLSEKSVRKQKKFRNICKKSGMSTYIGQMGEKETCKVLTKACGVEISSQCLVLELDSFVDIMEKSEDAMIEIGKLNKEIKITDIKLDLTKEGEDKLFSYCKRNHKKLIDFLERSLNFNCYGNKYDRLTYKVKFNGHVNYELLHLTNNLARNLFLDKFKTRSIDFESYDERVRTFDTYPGNGEFIQEMAKAGFIYSGSSITCTCYSCNQSIYGDFAKSKTSEISMIEDHIIWNTDCEHLKSNYEFPTDVQPSTLFYHDIEDFCDTTDGRIEFSLTRTTNIDLASELANLGFVVIEEYGTDTLTSCFKCQCNYWLHEDADLKTQLAQLEKDHLLCSGKDCPFLVKEKGISAIMNIYEDSQRKSHYKSSIILKLIMMRK